MYVLRLVIHFKRLEPFDAHDCSGMPDKYPQDEVVFRGGKRTPDDQRGLVRAAIEARIQKGGLRFRGWLIAISIFFITSLVVINTYTTGQFRIVRFGVFGNDSESYAVIKPYFAPVSNSAFLVRNKGCRIPAMDPHDPATKPYVHQEKPLVCEYGTFPSLVESNATSVFVSQEGRDYFYNKSDTVKCCWRSFWRTQEKDNDVTYDKECFEFEESDKVNAEFVKIECWRRSERIYKDYHSFLPRKWSVEERCRTATANSNQDHLSILISGLDSVSRLNFHRMMPMTVKALRSLGAVEMLGYTKVADNTYPNLVPVLSGLSQEELHDTCWQNSKKTFDECPFLWKNFSAAGYRTIFGEDACGMTTFNYLKPGFKNPPTDYYLRPFCIASEHDIGNTCKLNANLCVGNRKTFENLLHYSRKAAVEFQDDPYFGMFWQSSLTHDFFNYPQLGDESYRDFVLDLAREGLLNKTALIMMSDHGMRWGDFRQTFQGRMEDSLPFVFIVIPAWWQEKHQVAMANLRRNTRSLTTAFDLHETLLDLLNPESVEESSIRRRSRYEQPIPRGISWFLPIPDDRSCLAANISDHWCMCHSSRDVALDDPGLQEAANFLVSELNGLLQRYPQCATLGLKGIKAAKVWVDKADGAVLFDYTVTLETEPGDAVFEGSVRYRADDRSRKLVGTVSRLNAYGKQSACVEEYNMRLYCYCL